MEDEIITDDSIEAQQAIHLSQIISNGEYELVGQDQSGKSKVKVTRKLWHDYFSFAHAITLIVNKITCEMNAKELTDVAVVRDLLWQDLRNRMGVSKTLEKQWLVLQDFLKDMIARPLPSHDWGGAQITPGVTHLHKPFIDPISLLDDLYLIVFNLSHYHPDDLEIVKEYGQEVLKSLAPTGRIISNFKRSSAGLEKYALIYARHHLPDVDAFKEDESKGAIVTDPEKWKPIQLLSALLHDFAKQSTKQQCEELKKELNGVVIGEASSHIRYFIDTFFLPEIAPLGV